MCRTLKTGTTAIMPIVYYNIRDVIDCSSSRAISIARLDALESKPQFANKITDASTMMFSLYTFKATFSMTWNEPRTWSREWICKHLKIGIPNHKETNGIYSRRTKNSYIVWRVLATLEQHFKHLPERKKEIPYKEGMLRVLGPQWICNPIWEGCESSWGELITREEPPTEARA